MATKGGVPVAPETPDDLPVNPSPEQVREAVSEARELVSQEGQTWLVSDEHGWDRLAEHGAKTEAAVRHAGAMVAARADYLAADRLAEVEETWASRGVHDIDSYKAHLEGRIAAEEREWQAQFDGLEPGDFIPPERVEAIRAGEARIKALEDERLRTATGDSAWDMDFHRVRSEAYLEALKEQREMGPGEKGLHAHPDSQKSPLKRVTAASRFYPRDWLDQAHESEPIMVVGSKTRAHYQQSREHVSWESETVYREQLMAEPPEGGEVVSERVPAVHVSGTTYIEVENPSRHDDVVYVSKVRVPVEQRQSRIDRVASMSVSKGRVGCLAPGESVALHEYGHHMQHVLGGRLTALERTFVTRRTSSEGGRDSLQGYYRQAGREAPESLKDLIQGYRDRSPREQINYEWVRPDGFVDPYVGKQYPHDASEVFTMGVEGVFGGHRGGLIGRGHYRADPEHRDLVLGALASI